jgi:alanine dehydrogenase
MRIGLPREIKDGEHRVALTPAGVEALRHAGHEVIVEPGAGTGAGFRDEDYPGVTGNPWECPLVVKVKELQPPEYGRLRLGQTLFSFQHFGPAPLLLEAALASGATYVAFESVGQADSRLPILAPMSAIAGRLSVQVGAWFLLKQNGGSGVLPGKIVVLGAGNVGSNALAAAHGMGAAVVVFAKTARRFPALKSRYGDVDFETGNLEAQLPFADLVIGGVLTPGQMSPKLITRAMLRRMRPGSVLVDVGIDQGGIAETSRATTHRDPVFVEEGVLHYCVPNMPAAVPRTASLALERAALPFVLELAANAPSAALTTGYQVSRGKVVHEFLARDTGRPHEAI